MEDIEGDDDGYLIAWKKANDRYVQSHGKEGEEVRHCVNCDNVYPATREFWHVDKHAADGWQTHCKNCRNLKSGLDRKKQESDKIKRANDELLDRIVLETNEGRGLTPGSEVQEHVVDMFGGSKGLAAQIVATYVAATPGSTIREKLLRMIFQSSLKLEESGMTTKDAEKMTDEELKKEMEKQLRIFKGA